MAKSKQVVEPRPEEPAPKRGTVAPPKPSHIQLQDRAGNTQLRFLAREIRMANGKVKAIKSGVATVRLLESAGEIACWESGDELTAMISAEGYRKLNQIAQVTVLTPPTIEIADKGRVANPYVELNEATGAFKAGWVRKIAIAPGPLGNLVVTDRTTYLSLVEYLMEDLIGLAKRNPLAVVWGVRELSPAELLQDAVEEANADLDKRSKEPGKDWLRRYRTEPAELERAKKKVAKGLWGFYEVEPITGQGLWFDRTHSAVATVFRSYAQTGKFGIRKLEAIAYRNTLSDHPLLPKKKVSPLAIHEEAEEVPGRREGTKDRVVKERWVDVPVFFHEQIEGEEEIKALFSDYEKGLRTAALTSGTPDEERRKPERASTADERSEGEGDEQSREEREAKKASAAAKDSSSVEQLDRDPEPAPAKETQKGRPTPPPAPDEAAGLLAQLKTTEEIAGTALVKKVLVLFPKVATNRSKATPDELRAYGRALEAAINTRDNPK